MLVLEGIFSTVISHFLSFRASNYLLSYIHIPPSHPFSCPRTQRQKRFIPRPTKRPPNPTRRKIHPGLRIRRPPHNRQRHRHNIRIRDIDLASALRAARVLRVYTDDVVDADDVIHVRHRFETAVAIGGTGDRGGDCGGVGRSNGDGGVDAGGGDVAAVGKRG